MVPAPWVPGGEHRFECLHLHALAAVCPGWLFADSKGLPTAIFDWCIAWRQTLVLPSVLWASLSLVSQLRKVQRLRSVKFHLYFLHGLYGMAAMIDQYRQRPIEVTRPRTLYCDCSISEPLGLWLNPATTHIIGVLVSYYGLTRAGG